MLFFWSFCQLIFMSQTRTGLQRDRQSCPFTVKCPVLAVPALSWQCNPTQINNCLEDKWATQGRRPESTQTTDTNQSSERKETLWHWSTKFGFLQDFRKLNLSLQLPLTFQLLSGLLTDISISTSFSISKVSSVHFQQRGQRRLLRKCCLC